jgi:hypothetical protein
MPNKDVNLFIGVTSCRDWKPYFGSAFTEVICYTFSHALGQRLNNISVGPAVNQSNLSAGRQLILDQAINGDYTHLFVADDDMAFPPDTIEQLLKHDKDIAFPNVRQKREEINGVCLDMDLKRIDSTKRTGLERVSYGTLACTLIKLEKVRKIPRPHFEVRWREEAQNYMGEDHYFFQKLGLAGCEFWCDHDLTQSVAHVGDFHYKFPK